MIFRLYIIIQFVIFINQYFKPLSVELVLLVVIRPIVIIIIICSEYFDNYAIIKHIKLAFVSERSSLMVAKCIPLISLETVLAMAW